ncbi:hypothetical protein [Motilibacter deserti]|uniref:Uncharacterized protein n=1 Tax=Motilibacter deserti TaxID=2714956 RepID=A0ABX0GXK6_9ACTN|nr:hypothetical protein [Motilibacter deserti]NHC14345.1 hypothetical protein [Motilibacter deserti]
MWAWAVLWAVLLLGAVVVLGLLALSLWRKSKALMREVSAASRQLTIDMSVRGAPGMPGSSGAAPGVPPPSASGPHPV